jgi:hypothetical protein
MSKANMSANKDYYKNYCDSQSGVYPPDDFVGLLVEHWDNGQLKFRGRYEKGGKRVGQHICFWENGALQEVSYWTDGWVTGTTLWFREDGSKDCEKDYREHGGITRSWIERRYSIDDRLCRVFVWLDDVTKAEWIEPETRALDEEIGLNDIVDEAVRKFKAGDFE